MEFLVQFVCIGSIISFTPDSFVYSVPIKRHDDGFWKDSSMEPALVERNPNNGTKTQFTARNYRPYYYTMEAPHQEKKRVHNLQPLFEPKYEHNKTEKSLGGFKYDEASDSMKALHDEDKEYNVDSSKNSEKNSDANELEEADESSSDPLAYFHFNVHIQNMNIPLTMNGIPFGVNSTDNVLRFLIGNRNGGLNPKHDPAQAVSELEARSLGSDTDQDSDTEDKASVKSKRPRRTRKRKGREFDLTLRKMADFLSNMKRNLAINITEFDSEQDMQKRNKIPACNINNVSNYPKNNV